MRIESNGFCYELVEGWGKNLQENWSDSAWGLRKVPGVGVDRYDRIYLLSRSDRPIIVTDADGNLLSYWGQDFFDRPHGITITDKDEIFVADDQASSVLKFDMKGELQFRINERGRHSDTGCTSFDYRTVRRPGLPFNRCTNIAVAPNGDLFVADGYGNCRVHRFDAAGNWILSWGEPGDQPGEFFLPHGIYVSEKAIVYVTDRENHRIQLFDMNGKFITMWNGFHRPADLRKGPDGLLYLAENKRTTSFDGLPSRIQILSEDGEKVACFDNGIGYLPDSEYHTNHGIGIDSQGNLYVGEVGNPTADHLGIQKWKRIK